MYKRTLQGIDGPSQNLLRMISSIHLIILTHIWLIKLSILIVDNSLDLVYGLL